MLKSSSSTKAEFSTSQKFNQQQQQHYEIKEDDKFFTKLVSKENSHSIPSFRGASVAVPFTWETQPGTPKHNLFPHPPPPPPPPPPNHHHHTSTLSPPPSFYFNLTTPPNYHEGTKPHFKPKLLLNILFLRNILHLNKTQHHDIPFSPSSFSHSSFSSNLPSSSSKLSRGRRRRLLSMGSSSVFDDDFHVSHVPTTNTSFPKSILCFRA